MIAWAKRLCPFLALGLLLGMLLPASASDFTPWLVEDWCRIGGTGECPANTNTVITYERRDFGPGVLGPNGGQVASHSFEWGAGSGWVEQTWSFDDAKSFVPARGDGGQYLYSDNNRTFAWSTRDGGTPYDQIFLPWGCPYDGWVFFEGYHSWGRWSGRVVRLVNGPDRVIPNCTDPGNVSYTRWRSELANVRFSWFGKSSWQKVYVIITEHFSHDSIEKSDRMERGIHGLGYGWMGWQAWTTDHNQRADASADPPRCPPIYIDEARKPLDSPGEGWFPVSCRMWTNIVWAGDGHTTMRDKSWAP